MIPVRATQQEREDQRASGRNPYSFVKGRSEVHKALLLVVARVAVSGALAAVPHPVLSGMSAAADDTFVAGNNPAGMTRFDSRVMRSELVGGEFLFMV